MEQSCQNKSEHFRRKQKKIASLLRRFTWQLWTVEVIKPWTSKWPMVRSYQNHKQHAHIPAHQKACQVNVYCLFSPISICTSSEEFYGGQLSYESTKRQRLRVVRDYRLISDKLSELFWEWGTFTSMQPLFPWVAIYAIYALFTNVPALIWIAQARAAWLDLGN